MFSGHLGLGRAEASSYRDKEAPRGQRDRSKTTWKDTHTDLRTEPAQKQQSTSGHCDEECEPSS